MRNFHPSFSIVPWFSGIVGMLAVVYIGLIAVVMSYAALTVEFSQSVKNDEASIAMLEGQYLSSVAAIQNLDYHIVGYTAPLAQIFVPTQSMTALR